MTNAVRTLLLAPLALCTSQVTATELKIQPRVDVGGMYYEYQQQSLSSPSQFSNRSGIPSLSGSSISSFMPMISGGVTGTLGRFFLDFGVQYGFDGSGTSRQQAEVLVLPGVSPLVREASVVNAEQSILNDFDRFEYAITLGYRVSDNLSLYAGYKNAETDIRQLMNGRVTSLRLSDSTAQSAISGTFSLDGDLILKYDGPFIGGNYNVAVDYGWLNGVVSGNIGLAFLDGVSLQPRLEGNFTNSAGIVVPADSAAFALGAVKTQVDGTTVGLSFGLTWKGLTPISRLTYSFGATGYRYDFESNTATAPSFTETLVRFNAGLAYRFDI